MSADGSKWTDITTHTDPTGVVNYTKANVCLKAYTGGNVKIDGTAPTTSVHGIPAGWTKAAVTATFSASDTGGSGLAYTEYSLDGAAYVHGGSVKVSKNGTHTLHYRSTDNAGNVEVAKTATVLVDAGKPTTSALAKVTVKKGKKASFRFKVTDVTPKATVKIKIYKGTKLKKTLAVGSKPTGSAQTYKWTCKLPKGTYIWKVYATDLAGNAQ